MVMPPTGISVNGLNGGNIGLPAITVSQELLNLLGVPGLPGIPTGTPELCKC
ncbi:hypothetical protein PROFUN_17163 [Planoprotostelium fungivorum]|uniref:Uncharacterized protein n=1 Tax=Planoprotostelium fungivorum TaxID=1890364 RepID=A0A2P6MM29_9EUKA|nr:hypothetical protein PROFUN_17163 [Planoprotostelium fungivorum]